MHKSDDENPKQHIFYCDKSDWYEEGENGERDWSKSANKVREFWKEVIEEKIKNKDYNFDKFVFPLFETSRFLPSNPNPFEENKDISFTNAKFLSDADFAQVQFSGVADFNGAKFSGDVDFDRVHFSGKASFREAKFSHQARFDETKFSGDANFNYAQFSGKVSFYQTQFSGKVSFYKTRFSSFTAFFETVFENRLTLSNISAYGEGNNNTAIAFDDTQFSNEHRSSFKKWDEDISIMFLDVVFPDKVQFQDCNFKNVSFLKCDFVKVNFSHSHFNRNNKGRIILRDDSHEDFDGLSNTYRQLKRNLMEAKDWANAGDAYRSEMVMTRRSIWQQFANSPLRKWHLFFNWLIRMIYEYGSGYQQSITRPLAWLIVLIVTTSVLIWWNSIIAFEPALIRSIESAIPLVGRIERFKDEPTWVFYLLVIERTMSVTFIAFFVLATRARLRQ
ncbi:MAG: pentapeptide repeat-containing protein [Bacteroidota bacterium]